MPCQMSIIAERVNYLSSCIATNEELCICLICNEAFGDKEGLEIHLSKHSNENFTVIPLSLQVDDNGNARYEFHFSDDKSPQNGEIKCSPNSQNKQHTSRFKEIHVCSTCGKEFKRKDHLKKHSAIHSGIKPFTCLICSKSFSRKDRLKEHCVIHLSNGWSCYFCGKMFSQRCILRKHEMIHRGVKPYVCEVCDSHFSRKNDLLRHSTSHTGEKNYFCEICGKGFTQKRLVKRHLLVHKKNTCQS